MPNLSRDDRNSFWSGAFLVLMLIFGLALAILLIRSFYPYDSIGEWPGIAEVTGLSETKEPAKTLWDWMDLLLIPFVIAFVVFLFNKSERTSERVIARERIFEERLRDYLGKMTDLLLKYGLRTSDRTDEVRDIARAWTINTLRSVDKVRRGYILIFLYQSDLIFKRDSQLANSKWNKKKGVPKPPWDPVINLIEADFSGSNLRHCYFPEASLYGANLTKVDLSSAILNDIVLEGCVLEKAVLENADLTGANLERANLINANLYKAIVDTDQLKNEALSLSGAKLPDGSRHPK